MTDEERSMTEEQRNEVFLESQKVREQTFRAWHEQVKGVGVAFTGDYNDLTNKPELFSGSYNDLADKPELFDGNYDSLSDKPTIPTKNSELQNDSDFVTNTELDANLDEYKQKYQLTTDEGLIPYITTNNLDILELEPGNYACVASRFTNPPIPGDGGYVDIIVRKNVNGSGDNIRKTIIVHYTYSERTFIAHIHNIYGFRRWIEVNPKSDLSIFYEEEKIALYDKIVSVSNENTKVIGFITDTHYIRKNNQNIGYGQDAIYHVRNIIDVLGYGVGDMIIHGGDIINGKDNNVVPDLMDMNREMLKSPIPFFPCRGNHDDGTWTIDNQDDKSYSYFLNNRKWNQLVSSKYYTKYGIVKDENNKECTYGYYDFEDVKLRVIMLDIHDFREQDMTDENGNVNITTTNFQISQKQMDWLANVALKMPENEGWKVIVFSHISWYNPNDTTASRVRNGYQVHRILKAFNEHISDAVNNTDQSYGTKLSFNFTGTNHKVVATICGHNHKDDTFEKDGIRYIYCVQSTCAMNESSIEERNFSTISEDSWTAFVVDTNLNKLYLLRFGAEKTFEQIFNF